MISAEGCTLEEYLAENKRSTEEEVRRFLENFREHRSEISGYQHTSDEEFKNAILNPFEKALLGRSDAKRMRSALTRLFHDLEKRARPNSKPCPGLERLVIIPDIIHDATLAQDDDHDNSYLRNGVPTLHVELGRALASSSGSNLLFLPIVLMSKYPEIFLDGEKLSKDKQDSINGLLVETGFLGYGAQSRDIWTPGSEWWNESPTVEQYAEIAAGKSTFPLSCEMGAIYGGAGRETRESAAKIGKYAGVAFQIKDDMQDLDLEREEYGEDIREKKATLPLIFAVGDKNRGWEIKRILSRKKIRKRSMDKAIRFVNETDAIKRAEVVASNYADMARRELRQTYPGESPERNLLEKIIEYSISRSN